MLRGDEPGRPPPLGPLGWAVGSLLTGVWCWAVLRLLLQPGRAGFVEGLVAAGGWGLSLLPVHCTPRTRADGGESGAAGGAVLRALRRWWRGGARH
ncbi:hypothetical protein [Streptomyces sp. NPDC001678]|uniref:hypothetical protein n=1 Tax=Streptomyces sp. NPDC001678 TaxID=3364599 RepID=UPI0036829642